MAFFKFRKGGDEHPTPPPAIESVEVLRKRARHRLIGAAILVLAGVVGFPLLFDNQPRPIAVDIPIDIPDKNKVKPLTVAPVEAAAATAPAATPAAPAASTVAPAPIAITKAGNKEETIIESKPAAKPEPKAEAKPKAEPKPADKPADKPVDKVQDAAKAQALLDGKSADAKAAPPAAAAGRFVVQVGAYADAAKAREARQKLEKAGLKTYTQVVDTTDGKRTRVRVGPFESKAEADKAGDKIKKLDLPVAILEL